MRRLSGTDSLFLAAETPSWHQHVGGLTILEPGDSGLGYDDVVRLTRERMEYAPKFRWKLKQAPFGLDRPVWVDDPDFDVRHHVHRIGVPSPGGAREVGDQQRHERTVHVASILPRPRGRRHPRG